MTRLKESIQIVQRMLADAQSASLAVEGEQDVYCSRPSIEAQQRNVLEVLLGGLW